MIYADTSCLLKVLRPEPLSEAVCIAILANGIAVPWTAYAWLQWRS